MKKIESWFKNGRKLLEADIRNGQKHGKFVLWYENGQKALEGEWKDGCPDGTTTTWHEDGRIKQVVIFRNGKPGFGL